MKLRNYIVKCIMRIRLNTSRKKLGSCGISVLLPSLKHFDYPNNVFIEDYVSLGKDGHFFASPKSRITIKKGTIIASRCRIYTSNHNYDGKNLQCIPFDYTQIVADVMIKEGVWIGDSVIILPGVTIGKGAVIGAGSVVASSVPDYAVAVGNPAKVVKYRDAKQFDTLQNNEAYTRRIIKNKIWIQKSEAEI